MLLDNVKITWGIHKELFQLFTKDNKDYFSLFGLDPEITEQALVILLSDRDLQGKIISPKELLALDVKMLDSAINVIDAYFREFFFRNQQRVTQLSQAIQQSSL